MSIDTLSNEKRYTKLAKSTTKTFIHFSDQCVEKLGVSRISDVIAKIGNTGEPRQKIINDYLTNYSIQFDGSQNYLNLGTMGDFGSNLGSGFYAKLDIKTTQTTSGVLFGITTAAIKTAIEFHINEDGTGANVANKCRIYIRDEDNKLIRASLTNAYTFNDGIIHSFIITVNMTTNIVTISIDGNSQSLTYQSQNTPSNFVNFNSGLYISALNRYDLGSVTTYTAATIDNLLLGTSSSNLYGSYTFNEGTGTTTADTSGNGNTGTLTGSPLPLWVQ